ncbi:MAG: hypothetical protein ABI867_08090 [Kofleriaceae bacterium]
MNDVIQTAGKRGARLAKDIGPTRGLIGLAIVAAAVGGTIFLVRYLRARKDDMPLDAAETPNGKREKRKNMHVHAAH